MRVRVVMAVVLAMAGMVLASTTANARGLSHWYWPAGVCKAELQHDGVELGDGRVFNVAKAYCVGLHNHCWLSGNVRRYKVFIAVVRSYDGVVRRFTLTVTGRRSWSGSGLRIIAQYMDPSTFVTDFGTAAWAVAHEENEAGCWDAHP